MPLRPARCYRRIKGPPYTRKEYISSIPPVHIAKFEDGDPKGNFTVTLHLVSMTDAQIRSNALEAARLAATRYLSSEVGSSNYFFKLRIYPHHILRENKMIAGAGADRLQDGMRLAFGTPIGCAARVHRGQQLITVKTTEQFIEKAKEALRRAASKLPVPCRIVIVGEKKEKVAA
ncbi:MAG: 50S ribosomal protein L16 [Thermoprotei archaeon]|nr:MAG: 50S ribosomal protein L16 [Thermoprotei archaeon]RLF25444.1 MAG: 50S ribosomal protein L16 [Thermoprotei archaeon]